MVNWYEYCDKIILLKNATFPFGTCIFWKLNETSFSSFFAFVMRKYVIKILNDRFNPLVAWPTWCMSRVALILSILYHLWNGCWCLRVYTIARREGWLFSYTRSDIGFGKIFESRKFHIWIQKAFVVPCCWIQHARETRDDCLRLRISNRKKFFQSFLAN